ncbi:predicted protein [Uncinocarpus reesii 1704]|uniref:O-methyltransferase C-terminal domain-containing protein n=1 Tax=Uncinocarpus reesii (strain UAMH 1704) TaxID=336963 RepID=C4JD79_UNCRE|nr:uncharacterized protein UREG_00269 [Uncinocarpus reesii 1704]EEP75423.1 predicted protein [Uncinocarpus reesii 1704]
MEATLVSSAAKVTQLADNIQACARRLGQLRASEKRMNGSRIVNDAGEKLDAEAIHDVRVNLLDACRSLLNIATGPTEMLKNMALIDKHNLASLRVINHFQIASLVPPDGQISISEIAKKCNISEEVLARILRQAMTYEVFHEPKEGFISHTAASREIPRLSPLLSYQLDVCLPSTLSLLDWLEGERSKEHKSAFQIAHSTKDTWWSYAEKRPDLIQNYGRYMALITNGGPHDVNHVVSGFAWETLGNAIVIDVGGADGFVGVALARACPHLTVIVQDSPNLKENAEAKIPSKLKNRVFFAPHSFFEPQSAMGSHADVFLLRHILHDWEDDDCLIILRHLIRCMKPSARIIVAEQVFGNPGKIDKHTERTMRALDMQMMVQFGSKERTLGDWESLFSLADPSLEIVGYIQPPGSADTLMELRKK